MSLRSGLQYPVHIPLFDRTREFSSVFEHNRDGRRQRLVPVLGCRDDIGSSERADPPPHRVLSYNYV